MFRNIKYSIKLQRRPCQLPNGHNFIILKAHLCLYFALRQIRNGNKNYLDHSLFIGSRNAILDAISKWRRFHSLKHCRVIFTANVKFIAFQRLSKHIPLNSIQVDLNMRKLHIFFLHFDPNFLRHFNVIVY